MSLERHVFFRGKLPNKALLARVMKDLGFPFSIVEGRGSLEGQSGYMPMKLKGEETGVEFDIFEGRSAIDELEPGEVDPGFDRSANFRWGGDESEMLAALCASAALAKLTNGVVFDDEEGKLFSPDEAIEVAAKHYASLVKAAAPKEPGTRPADVKRYLKPLLKQRDDLVLIGRMLIIRPVRHLLRGAFLDRTSDKYQFGIHRYITPLYHGLGLGHGGDFHPSEVWQPHFLPELFDRLEQDVFQRLGPMTSLSDYAECDWIDLKWNPRFRDAAVRAFVLAGERGRAADYIDEVERSHPDDHYYSHWSKEQRAFLERDVQSLCAEYHAKEAAAAKALKLEGIWESSPFPVELPAAERVARTNETTFVTNPWVERPPWLLQDAPEKRGEIRFAKGYLKRDGRIVLLVSLTRDEAEEMHRTHQDYVLATRLTNGNLLVLSHYTGWSPLEPRKGQYTGDRAVTFYLRLYAPFCFVTAWFSENWDHLGSLRLHSIDVYGNEAQYSSWECCFLPRDKTEKTIHDRRSGKRNYICTQQTEKERATINFTTPKFGDFSELLTRMDTILKDEGYGDFV